jgi:hypothetical protein
MNTTSLVLNGRTAVDISLMPERRAASLTTIYPKSSSSPLSPTLFGASPKRPGHKRSPPSRDSPGWYNTEGGMTLDDFAARLNSLIGKFEQWQGKCAQNVVMALMRPTPIALFVLNPIALVLWIALFAWWLSGRKSE